MTVYSEAFEARIREWALERIPQKRHPHVRGVVSTAETLAARHLPEEKQRARLAGWLHDTAKHLDDETLLNLAAHYDYTPTAGEAMVPQLLHGVIGYLLAADAFDLNDPQLKSACAFHTTGDPEMNALDKIVLVADLIEPTRNYLGVEDIRRTAPDSLNGALLLALDRTIQHLLDKKRIIDPRPVHLRNQLLFNGQTYPE